MAQNLPSPRDAGSAAILRGETSSSPLWLFVENTGRAWPVLLGFNGALIGGRLYAHLGIGVPVIFTGLIVGAALLGRWWYSSRRHSLRAMLLLFQLTGWS